MPRPRKRVRKPPLSWLRAGEREARFRSRAAKRSWHRLLKSEYAPLGSSSMSVLAISGNGYGLQKFVDHLIPADAHGLCLETENQAVTQAVMSHGLYVVGADEIARSEEHTSELQSRGHLVCR